jgi:hypothetical protein
LGPQQKGYYEIQKETRFNTLFFRGPQRAAGFLCETLPRNFLKPDKTKANELQADKLQAASDKLTQRQTKNNE